MIKLEANVGKLKKEVTNTNIKIKQKRMYNNV